MHALLPLAVVFVLPAFAAAQEAEQHSALSPSTLLGSVRPSAQAHVLKVFVEEPDRDATGPLHIVYSDGTDVVARLPAKEGRKVSGSEAQQKGFADPQVAADKKTVGWTESYDRCCQSYPIPLVLTLYRSGKVMQRIRQGQMVWSWMFLDGGKRVAAVWGPTHGAESGDYQLYDTNTGRMLAAVFSDEAIQSLYRQAPDWAKQLEKRLQRRQAHGAAP